MSGSTSRKVVDLTARTLDAQFPDPPPETYADAAVRRFEAWYPGLPAPLKKRIKALVLREETKPLQEDAKALLSFMNSKRTGKRGFRPVEANLRLIRARLHEGTTVRECKAVIAVKWRQVESEEFPEQYFRPATLFNATKFAQYLGELPAE